MNLTAPILFTPIFRSYLWGGESLKEKLGKSVPGPGIWAESWELVDHGEDQSIAESDPWQGWSLRRLIETYPTEVLGSAAAKRFQSFPLLLKYLDCNNVLSVQVHPDDQYALQMQPPDLGKTEAWFIVDAKPGAVLYAGLKKGVTEQKLRSAIDAGRTEDCMHVIEPASGDCVFIPAGTVHALGSGLIVAEIQQASDTTFRLYDWNRVDANGKSRPLHIQQALEVIDFDRGPIELVRANNAIKNGFEVLVECDKFQLSRCSAGSIDVPLNDAFAIVTVPHGSLTIHSEAGGVQLKKGQTAFLPAAMNKCAFEVAEDATVLLARLPL